MFETRVLVSPMLATPTINPCNAAAAPAGRFGLRRMAKALFCALLLALILPAAKAQNILTVNTLADTATGSLTSCTTGGVCSLRDAIMVANSDDGDTINATGLVGTITLTSALPITTADMTINGPGTTIKHLPSQQLTYGENLLTVDGSNLYRVLNIGSSTTATINGLVIADGNADTSMGGGIYNGGTLMLTNCTLTGNAANVGGGIANGHGATMTIVDSTISGNSTTGSLGAGIYNDGTLTVVNSTISGNINSASGGRGGGIFTDLTSTLRLTNSTVSGNSAATDGGIYANIQAGSEPTVVINNSIVAGNTGADCSNCAVKAGINYDANASQIGGTSPLGPLQWNGGPTQTMMPLKSSSAICAGSTTHIDTATYPSDQRGFALPSSHCSSGLDQGAVQSYYNTVTTTADSGAGSLRAAISSGGDIVFDPTVFNTQKTISLVNSLPYISYPLNLQGPGASLLTVNGNGSTYVLNGNGGVSNSILFFTSQSTSNVTGITLTNGISDPLAMEGGGGAIYSGGALTLINSAITNSKSVSSEGSNAGGGIFNDSMGMMLMTGDTVSGNSAGSEGGGIYNSNGGLMLLMDSTISGNSVPDGGAGGGINNSGPMQLTNSTLSGNSASDGGGIYNDYAQLGVTDSTLSANTAYNDISENFSGGGGIYNYNDGTDGDGLITVINSIIAGNTSNGSDDLESCAAASSGTCTLMQAVQYDGGSYTIANDPYSIIDTAAHTTAGGAYKIALSPLELNGPLATTQTMMPAPGSVAIGGGNPAELLPSLTTDQRGFPRLTGGKVDIGAVQTNYNISFSQQPTNTVINNALATTPQVLVTETNTNTSATDNVSGVPVALILNGVNAGGVSGTLTESTDVNGHANFIGLKAVLLGDDYSFTVLGTAVNSSLFDVTFPAPTVTSVSPNSGPTSGGTAVTITGTNFTGATAVNFGMVAATNPIVTSNTQIMATSPTGLGTVDVTVTTSGGTSATSAADQFTYIAPTPTTLTATAGTPQSTSVNTAFGSSLQATVQDQSGNPMSGVTVTFTAPSSGASAVFSNSTNMITAVTNGSGIATVTAPTANGTTGAYNVAASVNALSASFSLTNTILSPIPVTNLTDDGTGTIAHCLNPALYATFCTLRDAIATAAAESSASLTPVIDFAPSLNLSASTPGVYSVAANGTLTIGANMKIQGPGANLLAIDGGGAVRVFSISSGTVSISGLTITNGNCNVPSSSCYGGGISNSGTLTLANSTVSNSSAPGVAMNPGQGGGIYNDLSATMVISGSTISGNRSMNGGGIMNYSSLTITDSSFNGNHANWGGGIYTAGTTAGDRPASAGVLTATNSSFGGDVMQAGCNACGGAIDNGNYNSTVTLANNLFGEDVQGSSTDNGGNVYANAHLSSLGNYGGPTQTMMPLPGSAGICAGTVANATAAGLTVDQRGNPRSTTVYNATPCVDAGAVQTAYSLSFTTTPSGSVNTGATLMPTAVVQLYDLNPATNEPAAIELQNAPISVSSYSGTLNGTASQSTASTGAASFGGLSVTTATTLSDDYLIASAAAGPYTVTVNSGYFNVIAIQLSPTTLTGGTYGSVFGTQSVSANGGSGNYTYAVTTGALPGGLTLGSGGTITGTPTASGQFNFTITATDVSSECTPVACTGSQSYVLNIAKAVLTVTADGKQIIYGAPLPTYTASYSGFMLSDSTTSGAISGTPSLVGPTTYAVSGSPYTITASQGTLSAANYTFNFVNGTLTVGKNTPVVSLTSSANPVFTQNTITLTATVGFGSLTITPGVVRTVRSDSQVGPGPGLAGPSGTVTFTDSVGSTTLCSAPVTVTYNAQTSLSTATCQVNGVGAGLAVGTHNITAVYSGDGNFNTANALPNPLAEVVVDFQISITGAATYTVIPGQSATFNFIVSPMPGTATFPTEINFTVSDPQANTTYTFNPASLAAGAGSTPVTLTIHTTLSVPSQVVQNGITGGTIATGVAPYALALLLLPFAGRLRRAAKGMGRMLVILLMAGASLVAIACVSGCGSSVGFFGQQQATHTVTITATSGSLVHTSPVTLTVE